MYTLVYGADLRYNNCDPVTEGVPDMLLQQLRLTEAAHEEKIL